MKYLKDIIQFYLLLENSRKLAKQNFVNSNKISFQVFKDLEEMDPSHEEINGKIVGGKYIYWMCKQVADGATIDDVVLCINWFSKNEFRVKEAGYNTDLYAGGNILGTLAGMQELMYSMGESNIVKKSNIKYGGPIVESGSEILYEDANSDLKLVKILNREASIYWANYWEKEKYGNTRWCISMENKNTYWENYSKNYQFYFLVGIPNMNKIAFAKIDNSTQIWSNDDIKLKNIDLANLQYINSDLKLILKNVLNIDIEQIIKENKKRIKHNLTIEQINNAIITKNINLLSDIIYNNNLSMDLLNIFLSNDLDILFKNDMLFDSGPIQLNKNTLQFKRNSKYTEAKITMIYNSNRIYITSTRTASKPMIYDFNDHSENAYEFYKKCLEWLDENIDLNNMFLLKKSTVELYKKKLKNSVIHSYDYDLSKSLLRSYK